MTFEQTIVDQIKDVVSRLDERVKIMLDEMKEKIADLSKDVKNASTYGLRITQTEENIKKLDERIDAIEQDKLDDLKKDKENVNARGWLVVLFIGAGILTLLGSLLWVSIHNPEPTPVTQAIQTIEKKI